MIIKSTKIEMIANIRKSTLFPRFVPFFRIILCVLIKFHIFSINRGQSRFEGLKIISDELIYNSVPFWNFQFV